MDGLGKGYKSCKISYKGAFDLKSWDLGITPINCSFESPRMTANLCSFMVIILLASELGVGHSLDLPEGRSGDSRPRPEVHSCPRPQAEGRSELLAKDGSPHRYRITVL